MRVKFLGFIIDIASGELTARLSQFVEELKDREPGVPFIINVPHEQAGALEAIKKAGFTLQNANNRSLPKLELV